MPIIVRVLNERRAAAGRQSSTCRPFAMLRLVRTQITKGQVINPPTAHASHWTDPEGQRANCQDWSVIYGGIDYLTHLGLES
jgi:hypothetical protein